MMLKQGQALRTSDGTALKVLELLGSGGQGEVWKVQAEGQAMALKWYHVPRTDGQREAAAEQRKALDTFLLRHAPPDPRFLWPVATVPDPEGRTFGYLMPLKPARFQGLEHLVLGQMKPPPKLGTLCKAAIGLAECFRKLHNMGACYKDINLGGPVIDPATGEVMVCDTDNVRVNKTPGNIIFIYFAAPELILGQGTCQTNTDIHSLAVLLFYLFIRHHPLEGARGLEVNVFNEAAQRKFYGKEPLFIFDPGDTSNRPVPGFHDPAIRNWGIYPQFLKDLFTRAFTVGLKEPDRRVREGEWMEAFSKLKDHLYYCSHCGTENFLDAGKPPTCWRCKRDSALPMRLELGDRTILLNHDTVLYPHHFGHRLDFSKVEASVSRHPQDPNRWGLSNQGEGTWTFKRGDGEEKTVEPGKNLPLATGIEMVAGSAKGSIRGW